MKKELPELPEKEESNIGIIVVPNDFPIENYLDASGNPVVCIKDKDIKAQSFATIQELLEKINKIEQTLNI